MNKYEDCKNLKHNAVYNTHDEVVSIRSDGDDMCYVDADGNEIEGVDESVVAGEYTRLQAEYDALQYQRDREPEYPAIADQLDYIYHNGIAKWKSDMVKPVKDAHPKP